MTLHRAEHPPYGRRLEPHRLAEGAPELLRIEPRGQVDQRALGARDRDAVAAGFVAGQRLRAEYE
jgi:hypothetical protein